MPIQQLVKNWNNELVPGFEKGRNYIGISQLGKPEFFLGLQFYLLHNLDFEEYSRLYSYHSLSKHFLFRRGHEVERELFNYLWDSGSYISNFQKEVKFNGFKGHIDGVLDGEYLIDVKCLAPSSTKKVLKQDHINYETQLACYYVALERLYKPALLIMDSSTCALTFHEYEFSQDFIHSLYNKTNKIKSIKTLDDVVDLEVLSPREIVKGKNKGRLTTPKEYDYYGKFTPLIYQFTQDFCVERQFTKEEIKENIQNVFFDY